MRYLFITMIAIIMISCDKNKKEYVTPTFLQGNWISDTINTYNGLHINQYAEIIFFGDSAIIYRTILLTTMIHATVLSQVFHYTKRLF